MAPNDHPSGARPADAPSDDAVSALVDAHDPFYVGTDGDGQHHYWSTYYYRMHVVESSDTGDVLDVETHDFPEFGKRRRDPADWREFIDDRRGWQVCNIGGDPVAELADAYPADAANP